VPEARLDDLMISYATDGGGVGPHFDSYDVFLLQAHGRRRWRIGRQKNLSLQEDVPLKILAEFFSSVGADLFGTRLPLDDLYGKMIALADKVPSEDLPTFAPSFFGTRQNPDLAAELTGLRTTNFNAAHLTRSLTRGMVAELVSYYDLVQGDARYVVSSGNGFRRNAVLRQELAICFGEDALIPPNQEEAAVGAALSAGVAVGLYSDWDDAGRVLYSGSLVGEHQ